MATFALMVLITANTITKRNAIYDKISTWLLGKAVWGNTVLAKYTDTAGAPSISVLIRFTQRPNLDGLFDYVKTEIDKLTGVSIQLSKHVCKHDEDNNQSCVFEPVVTIVR